MTVGDVMSKIRTLESAREVLSECVENREGTLGFDISICSPDEEKVVTFDELIDMIDGYKTLLSMMPVKEMGK